MSQIWDLKCSPNDNQIPVVKLAKLILQQAVNQKVDRLIFELDLEARKEIDAREERMRAEGYISEDDEMKGFQITFKIGDNEEELPPPPAYLFDPLVRALLTAAEIPYWKKGEISAGLETSNPSSKWAVESKDLKQRIQLRRIRANQALPT